jgi:CBS domain containing-hemolysin-like protein
MGEIGLLSIFGYTVLSLITGVIIGNVIVRVLSTTELGMLFANPLAMICSITGVIVVAVQYLP